MLKVCDQFTSVSGLKDFMRSCLRAEAIKSVAACGDKIGYAHGQANSFLITKHLEGGGLSLKDKQCAVGLASRFMAEETKPTPTAALAKTYLTAAADPELDIDEKKEQREHIAMLLSFYQTHKDDGDRFFKHAVYLSRSVLSCVFTSTNLRQTLLSKFCFVKGPLTTVYRDTQ